jgi:hypothetical protein
MKKISDRFIALAVIKSMASVLRNSSKTKIVGAGILALFY